MFTNMFQGIFQGVGAQDIQPPQFLLCLLVSLIIGVFLAFVYTYKIRYTQSFVVTLALIPAIVCLVILLVNGSICYTHFGFGIPKAAGRMKTLHITIPEHLDYTQIFDSLLGEYTTSYEILSVKTTNMGSLFKLTYQITLKELGKEKQLIDELRCRNGNLEIMITRQKTGVYEL